jgi:hypothetical protein
MDSHPSIASSHTLPGDALPHGMNTATHDAKVQSHGALVLAYRDHIDASVRRASDRQSKCTQGVLGMEGMSGVLTRHLYNNLCGLHKPDGSPTRYLEIGAWKGSSTISALYNNGAHCHASIIDNWSEFGAPRAEFERNMSLFLGWPQATPDVQVINEDCWSLKTPLKHAPYDVYLYDGAHSAPDHERALTVMWPWLANLFIFVVDDWNWEQAKTGTHAALAKVEALGARVEHRVDVAGPEGANGFWNGSGIFLIHKG